MKICAKCKVEKEEVDFTSSQLKLNWGWCKVCVAINNKKWKKENPEKNRVYTKKWARANPEKKKANDKKWSKNNPEKHRANRKKWAQANPEKITAKNKRWKQANPEKVAAYDKKWQQANRDKLNTKRRNQYQNDPVFRNRALASGMVRQMLESQGSSKNRESSHNYFPWTSEEYELHIEELFEPWMNWSNQGVYDPKTHHLPEKRTWQLDHIIPQSDLPYETMDHPNFSKSWNLSNLRPLDSKQNLMDGVNRTRHIKKDKIK